MKSFLTLLCFSIYFISYGQDGATLSIKGSASVSVKPTVTVISMNIQSTAESYVSSIENMINRIDQLTAAMEEIGFNKDEILTSSFRTNSRPNYTQGKRDQMVYDAVQTLKVQFKQSKTKLLEVINKALNSGAQPDINIAFELDNKKKKAVRDELIKLAIQDAKEKADLIANTAGLQLGSVKEINYGAARSNPGPLAVYEMADTFRNVDELVVTNMETANLTFSETIDIVYKLENK